MQRTRLSKRSVVILGLALPLAAGPGSGQLTDNTQTPHTEGSGINKSLAEQIGAGQGDVLTPGSSIFLIQRDPFRSIRRGRQLFQRKFTVDQGLGPRTGDGIGDIESDGSLGAGLADSCAACHGRAGERPVSAATFSPAPTAATLPTSSASASRRRCWPTRSPPICGRSAIRRSRTPCSTGSR